MKTTRRRSPLVIGHWTLVLSSAAVTASTPLSTLAADDAALRPIAFQNGVNQQSLSAETAELARAINELIDELQRNGFPVQSLTGLSELAAQLNALGGTEMAGIASRLRKLGESAQADPRATATEAYLAQQAIETRLKSLARQISIQQLRQETARRLEALIARQLTAQRETRAIAAAKPDTERQRLLVSDQSGIGEDLVTFFQTGDNLMARLRDTGAAQPTPGATPAVPSFSQRINGAYLTTLSTEAISHLEGKRYPDAFGRQQALIVELRKILQGILSSLPKEQRLASALQQVSALLEQEQALADADATTPESQQQTADQAQSLATQVAALSPEAAAALNQAAQEAINAASNPSPPATPSDPTAPSDPTTTTPPSASTPPPPSDVASNPPPAGQPPGQDTGEPNAPDPNSPSPGAPESPSPQNPSSPDAGTETADTPPGQTPTAPGEAPGTPPAAPGQPSTPTAPSATAQALAAAEAALQQALAQAQGQAQGDAESQGQNGEGENQPGQPNTPGAQQQASAQQSGQGEAQNGEQQQSGLAQDSATSQDGQSPAQNESVGGGSGTQTQLAGSGPDADGPAQIVGTLRREEREAFTALQGERYPAEYSAWVQQYWRNLAQDK